MLSKKNKEKKNSMWKKGGKPLFSLNIIREMGYKKIDSGEKYRFRDRNKTNDGLANSGGNPQLL